MDPFDTFSRQRWHDRPEIPVLDHGQADIPNSFRVGVGLLSITVGSVSRDRFRTTRMAESSGHHLQNSSRSHETRDHRESLAPIEGVWTKVLALLFVLSFLGAGIGTSVGFVDSVPVPTEMPLANASGLVTFRFQELGRVVFSSSNIG